MGGSAMALEIQKFIRGFHSISTANTMLKAKFAVDVQQQFLHLGNNDIEPVWVYNYTDKARGNIRLENECRGLILNASADIVSMSFSRFFERGSAHCHKLDWTAANIETQYDGTLVVVFAYRGNYFLQTLRDANAEEVLPHNPDTTYAEEVVRKLCSWSEDGDPFGIFRKHNENDKYTWAFEFVSPDNKHITPYEYTDLILLAAFNKEVPGEIKPEYVDQFASEYDIPRPAFRRVAGFDSVDKMLGKLHPLEEGLVLADWRNHRVKVPNPCYKAVEKVLRLPLVDLRPKHFAEIVLKGDPEAVATHYPSFSPILKFFQEVADDLMSEIQTIWFLYRIAEDRLVFAEEVKNHPFAHLLFMAWDGKIKDMSDALKHIKPKQLVELAAEYHPTDFERAFEATINSGFHGDVEGSKTKEAKQGNGNS